MFSITERLLDNYNRPKDRLKILKAIIIHSTANANKGANAMKNRDYFNTKPFIQNIKGEKVYASAHYIVDDNMIVQCIPDNEMAYHVGATSYPPNMRSTLGIPATYSPNCYTIGIEMCVNSDGNFEKTRQNTIELTRHLLEKYGLTINNVFRHNDITGKPCPEMMLNNAVWNQFLSDVGINMESAKERLKVNVETLNVRAGAGTNFPIQRKLHLGDIVEKTGQNGVWYQIGANEWIHSSYVTVEKVITLKVNVSVLNVRTGAGTSFPIKRQLHLGEIVTKIGQNNEWYQIAEDEWIHSDYVI